MKNDGKCPPGMLIFVDAFEPFAELLNREQAGDLLMALYRYHVNGEIADISEPITKAAFGVLKKGIDSAREGYEAKMAASAYGVYCKAEKQAGRTPLTRAQWEQQADGDPSPESNDMQKRKEEFWSKLSSVPP